MKKYKVLIVDDEEEIRFGVIKKITWENYGFEIVADAENGNDALLKCEIYKPDIVFTDIKMPFMTGLELSEKLKNIMPWIKVIIFSGSNDFEFTKKAINMNVFDYILKPIDSDELIEVLKKLKIHIDLEYENKKNLESLYDYYNESIPILREKFLAQIIEGFQINKNVVEYGESLGIEFSYKYLATAVMHIDDEVRNKRLLNISLNNTINNLMFDYCNFKTFIYLERIVVIVELYRENDIFRFIRELNNLCIVSEKVLEAKISAGVGKIVNDITDIKLSYKTARDALHYKSILGSGTAIYIEDVERNNNLNIDFLESDERELINAIKLKSEIDIKNVINNIFDKIQTKGISFNQYKLFVIELTTVLLKLIKTQNINIDDTLAIYKNIEVFKSIDEAREWFLNKAIEISRFIQIKRVAAATLLVEEAKTYVLQNFNSSDLSVDSVCNELHLSSTYFSTIFKKEVGVNFISYLTDIRLKEAKVLLKTTDYKTYIIAEKVGYIEANYFSYVFKKEIGVSPTKYRNL